MLGLNLDTSAEQLRHVLTEIRAVLSGHEKIEKKTIRMRLTELAASAINVELVSYVMTRDFEEFAAVREELLLRIMNFVEDSGTSLASPSQTLYLSGDPASKKDAVKQITDARQGEALTAAEVKDKNASSTPKK